MSVFVPGHRVRTRVSGYVAVPVTEVNSHVAVATTRNVNTAWRKPCRRDTGVARGGRSGRRTENTSDLYALQILYHFAECRLQQRSNDDDDDDDDGLMTLRS